MTWEGAGGPDSSSGDSRASSPDAPEHATAPTRTDRLRRWGPVLVLLAAIAGVAVVRVSLLHAPLSPDEAGFLRMGSQWSPGRSLYGDYWVSRPPGITALFSLASLLGGAPALRVIGLLFAVASVLLAAATTRTLTPGRAWPAVWTGVLVAGLVSTPNLDVAIVDGEVLALPFLMAGVLCGLRATVGDPSRRARLLWAVGAGAAGAAALSVKQNMLDVVVLLGGFFVVLLLRRAWRPALVVAGGALVGAVALVVPLLALAVSRGTTLPALWDAVVMFRFRAAPVLARPSNAKSERWDQLLTAFLDSGGPWVLALLPTLLVPPVLWRVVRRARAESAEPASPRAAGAVRADDPLLAWVAAGVLAWEAASVVAGGGFWLHYLVGVVPGLSLVLALSFARLPRRAAWWRWAPRLAVVGAVVAGTVSAAVPYLQDPPTMSSDEADVAGYLRDNARLGTTAVVAFGRATILQAADMNSPYPQLWSVPVLTDDPELHGLTPVLAQQRTTWVVTRTSKLKAWGLEDTSAMRELRRHYERVRTAGDLEVWRARSADPATASARAEPAGRPLP